MSGIYQEPPKSNQEAFDRVWQRFVVEKAPRAVQPGSQNNCQYRMTLPDGTPHGCAIGIQLPDALYRKGFEGNKVYVPLQSPDVAEHFAATSGERFLHQLQMAHDFIPADGSLEQNLRGVATRWNLTIPEAA